MPEPLPCTPHLSQEHQPKTSRLGGRRFSRKGRAPPDSAAAAVTAASMSAYGSRPAAMSTASWKKSPATVSSPLSMRSVSTPCAESRVPLLQGGCRCGAELSKAPGTWKRQAAGRGMHGAAAASCSARHFDCRHDSPVCACRLESQATVSFGCKLQVRVQQRPGSPRQLLRSSRASGAISYSHRGPPGISEAANTT